jgi:uncharacterized FlaG/YvyC family protein
MDAIVSALGGALRPAQTPDAGTMPPVPRDPPRVAEARIDPSANTSERRDDTPRSAVERAKDLLGALGDSALSGSRLSIRRDQDSGSFVYEFRDPKSGDLVRQFPAEPVLKAMAAQRKDVAGALVDDQA